LGTTPSICWPLVSLQFSLAPNHTRCLQPHLWLMFLPNLSRSLFTCSQLCFGHPAKPQQVAVHPGLMLDTCVGHSSYHFLATGFFAVQLRPIHIACSHARGSSTCRPPCKDVWYSMPAPDIGVIACFASCHMFGGPVSLTKLLPTCLQPGPCCPVLVLFWTLVLGTAVSICWPPVSLQFSLAPNHTHCLQPRLWLTFLPKLSRSLFTGSPPCFGHPAKSEQVAVHPDFMLDTCVGHSS
jgi:hypothetical protein